MLLQVDTHDFIDKIASANGSLSAPSARVRAERLQIFEKLQANTHNEQKPAYQRIFGLRANEKKKIVAFSQTICELVRAVFFALLSSEVFNDVLTPECHAGDDFDLADESADLMMELFPELENGLEIHFGEAIKKGNRRSSITGKDSKLLVKELFHSATSIENASPIRPLWDDRIRKDVREVADLSIRVVPGLLQALYKLDKKPNKRELWRQICMTKARYLPDWTTCRLALMRELLGHPWQQHFRHSPPSKPFFLDQRFWGAEAMPRSEKKHP